MALPHSSSRPRGRHDLIDHSPSPGVATSTACLRAPAGRSPWTQNSLALRSGRNAPKDVTRYNPWAGTRWSRLALSDRRVGVAVAVERRWRTAAATWTPGTEAMANVTLVGRTESTVHRHGGRPETALSRADHDPVGLISPVVAPLGDGQFQVLGPSAVNRAERSPGIGACGEENWSSAHVRHDDGVFGAARHKARVVSLGGNTDAETPPRRRVLDAAGRASPSSAGSRALGEVAVSPGTARAGSFESRSPGGSSLLPHDVTWRQYTPGTTS